MLANTPKSSAIVEIERLNLVWHEEAQFDLGNLSVDRRVQVRESEHYAPKAQVAQYAVQMGEVPFPPIVVTRNGYTVDGSTRVEARLLRKEKFTSAIVLDVDYKEGKGKHDAELHALAATLNQTGGQRLTPVETRLVAKTLVALDWLPSQIARSIGIKANLVASIKRELAAVTKFEKVGITDHDKVAPPILRVFGLDTLTVLNDVPYKNLVELSRDANLGVKEIKDMAKEMKATGSDAGMIAHVATKRGEMAVRIKEHALQGNGKPPASSQLRRHLGFVLGHAATPSVLVEQAPAAMVEHLRVVKETIAVLQTVAKQQEELIDA